MEGDFEFGEVYENKQMNGALMMIAKDAYIFLRSTRLVVQGSVNTGIIIDEWPYGKWPCIDKEIPE